MPKCKRDPVDAYVGQRIRFYRLKKSWSQTDLAGSLGLTFQQVQKYEKGSNRVGSGRLLRIAELLGQPVSSFFPHDVAAAATSPAGDVEVMNLVDRSSTMKMLQAFRAIENDTVRSQLVSLVVAISQNGRPRP